MMMLVDPDGTTAPNLVEAALWMASVLWFVWGQVRCLRHWESATLDSRSR